MMKFAWTIFFCCALAPTFVMAQHFKIENADVGTQVALTGKWDFQSGPPSSAQFKPVPVPQMLSRIQWWLDDAEDFKKWEQARLDALGFDTEKTDEGTYKITFDVPKDWPKDRHLWVEFDGVAMQCKTFCNDKPLGEHKGMFSRFAYDLSEHLKAGEPNTLTVWVSMEKLPSTDVKLGEAVTVNLSAAKVISMSKGMFGPFTAGQPERAYNLLGIWQPVKFVVRGGVKINDVFFQPNDELNGARVDVEVLSSGHKGKIKARAKWIDPDPKLLERLELSQSAELAGLAHVSLEGSGWKPKTWTPANPNLYKLEVTIEDGQGGVLDRWSQNVGFRTFKAKGNQLLLNGKSYFLRGANQLPYGKNPWDPKLAQTLIKLLHDGNVAFTRTHATPWNEPWLDAADEIGLAVSIEGIRPWAFAGKAADGKTTLLPPKEIYEHWLMENGDVVKRCRNHPSVIMFTVGNEMLLRDSKNIDKWKLMSGVVKQTRELARGLPVVCSSDYVRDKEFYDSTLKPAGIDDGDIDDMHSYTGWYGRSVFVVDSKFEEQLKQSGGKRPLIGQEMSTGYPDLDTGLPALRYTRDLLTPQSWVGHLAYPGNDPGPWLAEHAKVTKRWAEQMRFQRGKTMSGFALFSAECWFKHTYLPEASAYPVYESVKQALAPVGLALETAQRRFWSGDAIATNVYITNDDEQFRDLFDLSVVCELNESKSEPTPLAKLAYFETAKLGVKLTVPTVEKRASAQLVTRLMQGAKEISRTVDSVEIFPKASEQIKPPADVIVLKAGEKLTELAPKKSLRERIEAGATAIVFSPSKDILNYFPADILDVRTSIAEFADWIPAKGTKLVENLAALDLKWWARKGDNRVFIANTSHRLKPGGKARELIRYIPPHSYISEDKIPEQYRVVLSEIPVGKGRLWICDLDLDASVDVDPVASIFAENLYRAAADPESTKSLPRVPTHEEMLKGVKP